MKAFHASLGDLVQAQTGYTVRPQPLSDPNNGTRVLTAADLRGGEFEFGPPRRVGESISLSRYGVEPSEVFFKSRGSAFEAARLPEIGEPMVFAAPLVRLRHDPSRLLSDYLVWFLNSEPVQQQLNAAARGTAVRSVGPTELRQLFIPLPSLNTQHAIVELEHLRRREANLMARLEAARKTAFDRLVLDQLSANSPKRLQQGRK